MQREDYPKNFEDWYFILLSKCNACGIEGEGRVDGQGSLWASGGWAPGSAYSVVCRSLTISSDFWLVVSTCLYKARGVGLNVMCGTACAALHM